MKAMLTTAAALALTAGAALAQTATTETDGAMDDAGMQSGLMMTDLDRDADGMLNTEEFNEGFGASGVFSSYDANQDGMLTEDEYGEDADTLAAYDADASGDVTEEEFSQGIFGEYDSDADGSFSTEETETFNAEFQPEGRFEGRTMEMDDMDASDS